MTTRPTLFAATALALAACADTTQPHDHDHDHDHGLITKVVLVFTPSGGGSALSFAWEEDHGDVEVDDVLLANDTTYDLAVQFWDAHDPPGEDITDEVEEEGDEHQVFLTGTAVQGPATGANASALLTHAYDDTDANGLPLGILNTITTLATGDGTFIVTLRHLPEQSGSPTKTADLAETVATDGFAAIGGETDVQVTFDLTVE